MKNITYYDILKVDPSATDEEIKRAYRDLTKAFHPDRHYNHEQIELFNHHFTIISDAYQNIKTAELRKQYTESLAVRSEHFDNQDFIEINKYMSQIEKLENQLQHNKKQIENLERENAQLKIHNEYLKLAKPNTSFYEYLMQRGKQLFEFNEPKAALYYFNAAKQLGIIRSETVWYCGLIEYKLKNYQQALEEFNHAYQAGMKSAKLYLQRGLCCFKLMDMNSALKEFKKAIKTEPGMNVAIYWISRCHSENGNFKLALKYLDMAFAEGAPAKDYVADKLYYLSEQKRYDDALAFINQYIDRFSNQPWVYEERGYLFEKMGRLSEAIEDFKKILELQPNDVPSMSHLADLFVKIENYPEAIYYYTRLIDKEEIKSGLLGYLYYLRGEVKYKMGDIDGAIEDLNVASKSGFKQAVDLLAELKAKKEMKNSCASIEKNCDGESV